jgi:hypothetical protein
MSWFQKFDKWVSSIGDKTIKPVAQGAVYVTSALLGLPGAGKTITNAWSTQEEIAAENAKIVNSQVEAAKAQALNPIATSTNNIYFIGILIILFLIFTNIKKTKR